VLLRIVPLRTEALPLILGLGGNVGRTVEILCQAVRELEKLFGPLDVAPLYRSAPVSPVAQGDFLNSVVVAAVPERMTPREVLAELKRLETRAGRRRGVRFGPRPLDVDLLLCGDYRCAEPELTVPHPRMRERRFVLAPLADLAPDLKLPPDGAGVLEVLEGLGTDQKIERVASSDWASYGEIP
jgi:2-amino-4-hydroxy-6-hydroxymethyldihydropteridine diphosphokinase